MAISDSQKIDLLYKKLFGKAKTDTAAVKSPSNEAIASPPLIRGDKIWVDSNQIPATPPVASTPYVAVYKDGGTNPSVETTQDPTSTPQRTWLTGLTDWIPPEFGPLYQVLVYVDVPGAPAPQTTGTQIFPDGNGNNDGFYFDYQAGILHFLDTNLPLALTGSRVPYIVGYRYIGALGLGAITPQPATTSTLGIVRLDAAPINPADPIVITTTSIISGGGF